MCFWGWLTSRVGENKGYPSGSFFWWGFGLAMIGLLVVLSKPDRHSYMDAVYSSPLLRNKDSASSVNGWRCPNCGRTNTGSICSCGTQRRNDGNNVWECPNCGKKNPSLYNTCDCGYEKGSAKTTVSGRQQWEEIMAAKKAEEEEAKKPKTVENVGSTAVEKGTVDQASNEQAKSKFDEVKAYKELLDSGIISQEEFDRKRKELLGL